MRAIKINRNTATSEIIGIPNANQQSSDNSEFIWLDIQSEDKAQERHILDQSFNISELAIDDAQRNRHSPKFEQLSGYSFLLIKELDTKTDGIDYNIIHISFFVCDSLLITVHNESSARIDSQWDELSNNNIGDNLCPYSLLYTILKKIINRYTSLIYSLECRLEEIEDSMIENPNDKLLSELIRYNTKTQYLHRIFNNQDIVTREMLKFDSNLSADELKHKYIDVQEHMERLAGLTGLLNNVIKSLIDGYISVSGHKLNQIMKTLTIVAVIFLPLTFIAGIYGMNFEYIPELQLKYGYFAALGSMAMLVTGLLMLFRKLKWL